MAGRSSVTTDYDAEKDFLLKEGLDLLSAFRAIKSRDARRAVLVMVAAIAQAEEDATDAALEPKARNWGG